MRFAAGSFVVAWLIAWQSAVSWAIGPMGFSDPPPTPTAQTFPAPYAPQGETITSSQAPIATSDGATITPANSDTFDSIPGYVSGCNTCGPACQHCGKHHLGSCLCIGIFCNMPQHYPYPTTWDRYYYFRPYQYFQVTQLQETVASWGQDPRNISDNRFFEKIYEQVGAPANPNEYQPSPSPESPESESVPTPKPTAPKPAPEKSDDQSLSVPSPNDPPLKFTQESRPKRRSAAAIRPGISQPKKITTAKRIDPVPVPPPSDSPLKFTLDDEPEQGPQQAIRSKSSDASQDSAKTTTRVRAIPPEVEDGKQVELIRFVVP